MRGIMTRGGYAGIMTKSVGYVDMRGIENG
jgi:hypothetical protein